jgi:hypothetical protein
MWTKIGYQHVGGLREIGFFENSDNLLVLGGSGRTVFNCLSNEKIARDRVDYYTEKWNWKSGIIEGFEQFKNQKVICSGFEYKDNLKKETADIPHAARFCALANS